MCGTLTFKPIKTVIYSNGMKPVDLLPRFYKDVRCITIGNGQKKWGAPEHETFIITHDEPYNITNIN